MTGKGSGAHLPGLGEEGWVWGRSVCGQKVQTSGFLYKGELSGKQTDYRKKIRDAFISLRMKQMEKKKSHL